MSVIGLPPASVLVEARRGYSPASDPADPHAWSIEIRDFDDLENLNTGLSLVWSCPRCKMQVLVNVSVRAHLVGVNPAFMRDKMVMEMLRSAHEEGAKVHPRCSELRAVVEVMNS